jgi:hypothetical protein
MRKTDQDQAEAVTWQRSNDDQNQCVAQPQASIRVGKHNRMITPRGKSDKRLEKATPKYYLLW